MKFAISSLRETFTNTMKLSFIHYFIVASALLHLFPRVYMMIVPHIARFAVFVFVLAPIAYAAGCSESPESATPPATPPSPTPPVPTPPSPTPPSPTPPVRQAQVRVATFNVHRLFDTVCDSKNCGGKNYEPQPSQEEYDAQIADIARSIRTIDADIVLLQEIEKESGIVDLQNALSIYPAYAFGECGYKASLDVAILTRGTIDAVETYRSGYSYTDPTGKPRPLSRELIRADIDLNGIKISAFTTHLVSRVSDPTSARRRAEAAYTQQVIADFAAQNPQRFIVFGGDLNDTPTDTTVIDLEKDGILIRDAKNLPPATVYTWGNKVAFDHLFHNAPLSPHWAKTARICNDNPATGLGTSDHCALKSTYTFPLDDEL